MNLTMFQIDAFAERVFEGNPACVIPLQQWLDDSLLQAIAEENNLSETAFFVPVQDSYELRWFTPVEEVDLCGHATLASAYVLFEKLAYSKPDIHFETRSGRLTVSRHGQEFWLTFPATVPQPCDTPPALVAGLGKVPKQTLLGFDYIAVYESEDDIKALDPDFAKLQTLDFRGVIATAPGRDTDFVSRCFFPKLRVNEDPVTGSAHCELAPFWGAQLNRKTLRARQLSRRGGLIMCEVNGAQVILKGRASHYMTGEITVPTLVDHQV